MEIRYWGVRGSVAVSGAQVAWIGGNTPCVEVTAQGERLILDAGTGLRGLGERMMREKQPRSATMLFSHLHWDHVQGFPFFTPAYVPGTELSLYGPGRGGDLALLAALSRQMEAPHFPVPLGVMGSKKTFQEALSGVTLELGPFQVTPFELPHPQGCLGYRIAAEGKVFVYATDVELSLETLPREVARSFEGADALCMDAMYTPDEYNGGRACGSKKGWGHSTMIEAARIAEATGAKRLYLFHHDPAHNDDAVEAMTAEARNHFQACEPAREGARVVLGRPHLPQVA